MAADPNSLQSTLADMMDLVEGRISPEEFACAPESDRGEFKPEDR